MKEHAKKALKHDISVAGKTIPTMIIVALFLVGGGSAALLNSFGTVSGTADVDQAIELNSNNIEEQSASWAISDITAGDSVSGEAQTLNNNLDEEVTVDLESTVTPPTVDDESNVQDSGESFGGEYLVLQNGETFTNIETNSDNEEPAAADEAETSYVYTGSETGVKASYTSDTGHVHSGLWFNVTPTSADQAEIGATVDSGSNDWLYGIVEYEGTPYLVGDFNSPGSAYGFTTSETSHSYKLVDSDQNQIEDISEISSRTDFEKGKSDSSALPTDGNFSWSDVTVHYAVASTGTSGAYGGGSGSLTYTDFRFSADGDPIQSSDSLITGIDPTGSETDYSVASGDSELGFAADFDVAAYPGAYDFDLEVKP